MFFILNLFVCGESKHLGLYTIHVIDTFFHFKGTHYTSCVTQHTEGKVLCSASVFEKYFFAVAKILLLRRVVALWLDWKIEWIHLLMENRIPLETCFLRIPWKTDFHKVCGKCTFQTFHEFIYTTVENNFPQILWKAGFHSWMNSLIVSILSFKSESWNSSLLLEGFDIQKF